ncbi:hypothetical protein BDV24DRAFT_58442 [Aspergillus arachidicola]|uniref:Uncharacterized protein n=1 Tax=Aspergillus arachidicola TaxID=656916 RepID=A0A5N6Y5Z2_9EURO|nr:hypothetical protein BDV24DRAFT_58442 [Aspergillus arachidicola]
MVPIQFIQRCDQAHEDFLMAKLKNGVVMEMKFMKVGSLARRFSLVHHSQVHGMLHRQGRSVSRPSNRPEPLVLLGGRLRLGCDMITVHGTGKEFGGCHLSKA